jgi:hypothetical protein
VFAKHAGFHGLAIRTFGHAGEAKGCLTVGATLEYLIVNRA